MPTDEPAKPRANYSRVLALLGIALLLIAAVYILFEMPIGAKIRADPQLLFEQVRSLNRRHPVLSVMGYLVVYFLISLAMLPVWWLQLLAGAALGLYQGSALSLIAATAGAAAASSVSRWVGGDYIRHKVEPRLDRLKSIDHALGHNGLLVVFAVRLVHLLPFGICNYALGLTRISMRDIIVGTFLGSVPAVAFDVGIGAGYHPWRNPAFLVIVGGINVLLLVPVALRYWMPDRFAKWGLE